MDIRIKDLIFVDFEASSLATDSWPVEVGLAWIDGPEVHSWSSLIRPAPGWSMTAWSEQSANIHGIPLDDLRQAPPAQIVAEVFLDLTQGRHMVSDAPGFEDRWARRLIDESPRVFEPSFLNFDLIAASACRDDGAALDAVYEHLARTRTPHRAGPDAMRLARCVRQGLEVKSGMRPSAFG